MGRTIAPTRSDLSSPIANAQPPGLAFGAPDDRLQRGVQYAAAFRINQGYLRLLDHPLEAGDDSAAYREE
jgi:hypothetical protein